MQKFSVRLIWGVLAAGLMTGFTAGCATTVHTATKQASPSSRQEDAERLFEVLDVDGNGKISREEARSGFQYLIASYDRGGRTEILAAKPGDSADAATKKKSKRRPTTQDANRAFEALFEKSSKASDSISKDEFKKLVVKASDNPESDPFVAFY
jgi:hypothetical protein